MLKEIIEGRLPQGWPHLGYTQREFTRDKLYAIKNVPEISYPKPVTVNEHSFFPNSLTKDPIIVDLGCCEGGFFRNFKQQFSYGKFIGIEANPLNYEKIKDYTDQNTYMIYAAVCSEKRNEIDMEFLVDTNDTHVGSFVFSESSAALKRTPETLSKYTVPTIKISEIFERYDLDRIDLLKVDIEGAEWEVLLDLDEKYLNKIGQLCVEFHDFIDPTKKEDTQKVISRLKSLGYKMIATGAPWFYGTEYFDCTFYK
jgi:FkbM family methyltransferase